MFIKEKIEDIDIFQIIVDQSCQGVQSNTEGKSTSAEGRQYDLTDKINTTLKPIIGIYNMIFLGHQIRANPLIAWTVVGEEGCYHTVHRHNNDRSLNHISTVLYLQIAENTEKDDKDHRGGFYYFDYINDDINIVTIKPQVGDLFLFPIVMFHGSYPQAKGFRQTLNIDFEIMN